MPKSLLNGLLTMVWFLFERWATQIVYPNRLNMIIRYHRPGDKVTYDFIGFGRHNHAI